MSTAVAAPAATHQSFFGKIASFFKHAAVMVDDAFAKIFGADAAHTFATGAEAILSTALGQIALSAVTQVQNLADPAQRHSAAFSNIVAAAKSNGIAAGDSIVNLLIETALQKLKGSFGVSTP
jgi:hypothetical protein